MRLLLSIFFLLTTPIVIFLACILYGGFSSDNLKTTVLNSGIYNKAEFLIEDPNLSKILTPSYLQDKSEKAIDDSALWITGKTDNAPVISFKDIKEEFLQANPELLESLKDLPKESEEQFSYSAGEEGENPKDLLNNLVKNDFEIPLKDTVSSLKITRSIISILLPVQIVLMILCLVGLFTLSKSIRGKLRWIGITLLLSSIFSLAICFVFQSLTGVILSLILKNENELVALIYPIFNDSLRLLVNKNKEFQVTTSLIMGVLGVVCTVLSFLIKNTTNNKSTPKSKKKTT